MDELISSRYLPLIHAPPPSPYPGSDSVSLELGGAVPVSPSGDCEGPECALEEWEEELWRRTARGLVRGTRFICFLDDRGLQKPNEKTQKKRR